MSKGAKRIIPCVWITLEVAFLVLIQRAVPLTTALNCT